MVKIVDDNEVVKLLTIEAKTRASIKLFQFPLFFDPFMLSARFYWAGYI